jgi:hypothetical protein
VAISSTDSASNQPLSMLAAIAGTTRRMSMPATVPIAKAARVQAANAIPLRSNRWASNGVEYPASKSGWLYQ